MTEPRRTSLFIGLRRTELAMIGLFMLLFSEALLSRIFATPENPEGGAFLRFLWLPIYGYAAIAIVVRWRDFVAMVVRSPALVLLALLAVASMFWSIDPSTSLRRGIAILFTTFFGFYLASTLSWKEMIRLFGVVWIILAIGNAIAGGLVPSFGRMQEIHPGAWQGLWFEKNAMGGFMARASFLFGFLVWIDKDHRRWWLFGLLSTIFLVLMSTSKTSLLGMMLGFGILLAYLWMQKGKLVTISSLWLMSTVAISAYMVLIVAPEAVVAIIGRDLTLTGRTDIWEVLIQLISERPLLGYGYGAFWGADSMPAYRVRLETEWIVPTAHNGILEVVLAVGWLGGGLFIFDFLINLVRSVTTMTTRPTSLYAFGYFILFAMFSISESVFLQQNSITWVTYVALVGKLSLDARNRGEEKERARRHRTAMPVRSTLHAMNTPVKQQRRGA